MNIQIKKLSELAVTPTKNKGDAGYDLYSTEDFVLQPMHRHLFKTNIAISIPEGYYGRIADRSGNALKKGLHVLAGVIDSTYRGDIGVVLINIRREHDERDDKKSWEFGKMFDVEIKKGDRIAQIIFEKYEDVEFQEQNELAESARGDGGFGSSGL